MSTRTTAQPAACVAPASNVEPAAGASVETCNRRDGYRHRPRGGHARRLPADGEPDLFVSLLDISAGGVRLVLKGRPEEGDHLEVGVTRPGGSRLQWLLADVVWCVPTTGVASCVGARFLRRLTESELRLFALREPRPIRR